MKLDEAIDAWVTELFDGYKPLEVNDNKVIHDPILGTNLFYRHEIALLDSPLLQRLRYISQTGLAYLTYPSARHSRFEHTLGMTVLATRFFHKLNESLGRDNLALKEDHERGWLANIRVAALLHDCGHALFSHASEEVYGSDDELAAYVDSDDFEHCKPHEILSYLIITSDSFKTYFKEYVEKPYPVEIDLDVVAKMIVGKSVDAKYAFLTEIINGPFDADKLEYISRDGYFSGIRLIVDLDRLFHILTVRDFPDGARRLVLRDSTPLEQVLFSKMSLFSTVYHHQKVKACDCMLKGIIESLHQSGEFFRSPVEYLTMAEQSLIAKCQESGGPELKICQQLMNRVIFKRALVISCETINNYQETRQYKLTRLTESPSNLFKLREKITDRLNKKMASGNISVHEVWVDLPDLPSFRESQQSYVLVDDQLIMLEKLFPAKSWLSAYADRKWKGHVFGPADVQKELCEAATEVLSEKDFGLDIDTARNQTRCHLK